VARRGVQRGIEGEDMSSPHGRVDLDKQMREIERLRAEMRELPAHEPTVTTRAVAKIVQDVHLEGRMGKFTVHSDEPASRGGTELGPSPLQYIMVGVAF
jgi:hypothetical protein